ncbi:hypothetical protein [uncultured Marivita sp.]|uniref:hypothetical protein n=1 Tax=uncultured Marivita sp. TaxID=888080 RepID=UPI0025F9B26F|nr:hypothetical protein [uncultured Marivita sp.]
MAASEVPERFRSGLRKIYVFVNHDPGDAEGQEHKEDQANEGWVGWGPSEMPDKDVCVMFLNLRI